MEKGFGVGLRCNRKGLKDEKVVFLFNYKTKDASEQA